MRHDPEPDQDRQRWRLLDQTLRDLPPRPAPGRLELRVFAELRRRAAQPWWHRRFAYWPWPARMVFVVVCMGSSALALVGGQWTVASLASVAQYATGLLSTVTLLASLPTHFVPPVYLDAALAAGAVLYAMLFALGAFGYRALYLNSPGR
jgi:hypothetical protein